MTLPNAEGGAAAGAPPPGGPPKGPRTGGSPPGPPPPGPPHSPDHHDVEPGPAQRQRLLDRPFARRAPAEQDGAGRAENFAAMIAHRFGR